MENSILKITFSTSRSNISLYLYFYLLITHWYCINYLALYLFHGECDEKNITFISSAFLFPVPLKLSNNGFT